MSKYILLDSFYDTARNSVLLQLYDTEKNVLVNRFDKTNHKPFCYTELPLNTVRGMLDEKNFSLGLEKKFDVLNDKMKTYTKITMPVPRALFNMDSASMEKLAPYEYDTKYHEAYICDKQLIFGCWYDEKLEKITHKTSDDFEMSIGKLLGLIPNDEMPDTDTFRKDMVRWARVLAEPMPKIKRLAFDIEIEAGEGFPDIEKAQRPITAVGFEDSDNLHKVLVLNDENIKRGEKGDEDIDVVFYDTEKELLTEAFNLINSYPVVLSYNGDQFDVPYMINRARKIGIRNIPVVEENKRMRFKNSIHIDLYKTMQIKAFKVYVFNNKYSEHSLDAVSKAILNESKIEHEGFETMTMHELAKYCWNDARLVMKFTTQNNEMLMNLFITICRVCRMGIGDITRYNVGQWIKTLLQFEHRRLNYIMPTREILDARSVDASTSAVVSTKKYAGGFVMDPSEGVHFGVTVLDFASLYPSIIKRYNISYESVRCNHLSCKSNMVPDTPHWRCTKRNGVISAVIGSLRELRVGLYKSLAKQPGISEVEKQTYDATVQALKVILNASYGVMGFDKFQFYFLPAAESITALGRHIIQGTKNNCENTSIDVIYGDSVPARTPVTVRSGGHKRRIMTIGNLFENFPKNRINIWTDDGWQKVHYVYGHYAKKRMYSIYTDHSFVECTEDHSLVINGKETKPSELNVGDQIETYAYKSSGMSREAPSPDLMQLWGTIMAKGKISHGENGATIMLEDLPHKVQRITDLILSGRKMTLSNKDLVSMCEMKEIPSKILNLRPKFQRRFLDAFFEANGGEKHITKHQTIIAGLVSLLNRNKIGYKIFKPNIESNDEMPHIGIERLPNEKPHKWLEMHTIRHIDVREYEEYVHDIETANHHFCGGIGNVLLHNTDSLFIKNATENQLDTVMNNAKEEYGVDLEVDKEYRYCVLSKRKKNYMGVFTNGKFDVKGLSIKKSNTPDFIRDLFNEISNILIDVENMDDLDKAKTKMKEKIHATCMDVDSDKIPHEKMAFKMMLNMNPEEYVKNKTQHVQVAQMIEKETNKKLKKGDTVRFIKTHGGAAPVGSQYRSKPNPAEYIKGMKNILNQILEPLKLDFDEIHTGKKQTGMDQFF